MSAQHMLDTAPLGALIRYSNGELQPPARFTRKVNAWERENGVGRLIKKEAGVARERYTMPASLTLHAGDYGSQGCIVIVVNLIFHVTSRLTFTIVDVPKPGMARVLTSFEGVETLRHLAADHATAEAWLREHQWSNARIEVVADEVAALAMEQAA